MNKLYFGLTISLFLQKQIMYKSFRDMPVWQSAHLLSGEIFSITVDLPKSEDYGLTSQIRRSANSVSANISEGFGRAKKFDKAHFYTIARGSATETQNHLDYGLLVGYFSQAERDRLNEEYEKLIISLNKIIKTLVLQPPS